MVRKLRNLASSVTSRFRSVTEEERQASAELDTALDRARSAIANIAYSFDQPWQQNPGTGTRAVLGLWANKLIRHLAGVGRLSQGGDLSKMEEVEYSKMMEIWLEVRKFA
jgi:hypothetical protein